MTNRLPIIIIIVIDVAVDIREADRINETQFELAKWLINKNYDTKLFGLNSLSFPLPSPDTPPFKIDFSFFAQLN